MRMDAAHLPLDARIEAALFEAAELLRRQEYYTTHEVLELVWLDCAGTDKAALSGLILLASALHKQRKQRHPRAARQIFARALTRLAPLNDFWRGINLRAMERMTYDALHDPETETMLIRSV